jgi:hypothetical protein
VYWNVCCCRTVQRANDRPGGVIVRFLSRFRALEESSANDRPGGVNVRTAEEGNDCCRADVKLAKKISFSKI